MSRPNAATVGALGVYSMRLSVYSSAFVWNTEHAIGVGSEAESSV